jgi:hypothetical protein
LSLLPSSLSSHYHFHYFHHHYYQYHCQYYYHWFFFLHLRSMIFILLDWVLFLAYSNLFGIKDFVIVLIWRLQYSLWLCKKKKNLHAFQYLFFNVFFNKIECLLTKRWYLLPWMMGPKVHENEYLKLIITWSLEI